MTMIFSAHPLYACQQKEDLIDATGILHLYNALNPIRQFVCTVIINSYTRRVYLDNYWINYIINNWLLLRRAATLN